MFDAFGNILGDWQQIIVLLSILSMFLGAFAAIGQNDFKRLLAYSSIAHMGYALIGLAAGTEFGVQSVLEYMTIYITMNIRCFRYFDVNAERWAICHRNRFFRNDFWKRTLEKQ